MEYSITLKRALSLSLIVGFLCVGAVGCDSEDEDDGTSGAGGAAGSTGGAGGTTGGAGGTTGGAGGATGGMGGMSGGAGGMTGGMGGAGGANPLDPISCSGATAMCGPVSAGGMMLPPCCDAANGNICGARTDAMDPMKCTGVGQEGVDDVDAVECPGIVNALELDALGCCRPDGTCGFRSASLMGCVERSVYPTQFLSSMEPTTSMFPLQTINCTPGGGDDAGM